VPRRQHSRRPASQCHRHGDESGDHDLLRVFGRRAQLSPDRGQRGDIASTPSAVSDTNDAISATHSANLIGAPRR
jgi:hypothetical protein